MILTTQITLIKREQSNQMIQHDLLLFILSGITAGAVLGIIGAGSGIIAVVILVYILGMPIHQSIAIALFNTGISALFSTISNAINRKLDIKLILKILIPSLIFAPIGTELGLFLDPVILEILYSLLTLVIGFIMWKDSNRENIIQSQVKEIAQNFKRKTILKYLAVGSLTGFLSGFLGFSGGIIIVPGLVILLKQPIKSATLNSIAIIAVTSLFSIASHSYMGNSVSLKIAISFSIGGIIGIFVGNKLQERISSTYVKRFFAIFLLTLGGFILARKILIIL